MHPPSKPDFSNNHTNAYKYVNLIIRTHLLICTSRHTNAPAKLTP